MIVETKFNALLTRFNTASMAFWENPNFQTNQDLVTVKGKIKQYLKDRQLDLNQLQHQNKIQQQQNNNTGILIDDSLDRLDHIRREEGPAILSAFPRYDDLNGLLYKEYFLFLILCILGIFTLYQFKMIRSEFQKLIYKRNYIYKV